MIRILLGSVAAIVFCAGAASAQERRNVFGLDVAGRTGIIGLIYERDFTDRIGIGVGAGLGWDIIDESAPGLLPIYATWSPIGGKHRLHVGAGIALAHVDEGYREYAVGWEPRIGWSAYRTAGIGYEYRGAGTIYRVTMNGWYQPLGLPGGILGARESGFFWVPAFFVAKRF